jgi:hypothetical protein
LAPSLVRCVVDRRTHWNDAWTSRGPEKVSWYQAEPEPSLGLVTAVSNADDVVIDVGGGASALAGALLAEGYSNVTVLDVSAAALDALRTRLADSKGRIRTIEADVLEHHFYAGEVAIWHDRAVFHFLTEANERARYRAQIELAVRSGGHVIVGTFAADGPTKCSGLPVERYDAATLVSELGPTFRLVRALRHEHQTPSGAVQPFTFVVARRAS